MLVVILWPGPIPVGHVHTSADSSTAGLTQLSRHLDTHHCDWTAACSPHDWHLHWILPAGDRFGMRAEDATAQLACVPICESNSYTPQIPVVDTTSIDLLGHAASVSNSKRLAGTTKLVGQHSDRTSAPTLLVVMRC